MRQSICSWSAVAIPAATHRRYPDRLRCGRRNVQITIAADPRPPKVMQRDGPLPQTRADPRRQG
jgi:hypothetical protein